MTDYDPLQELLSLFEGVKADTGPAEDHSDWPVDRRLSQRIIDGNRNGLEADLDEALESGTRRWPSSTTFCSRA